MGGYVFFGNQACAIINDGWTLDIHPTLRSLASVQEPSSAGNPRHGGKVRTLFPFVHAFSLGACHLVRGVRRGQIAATASKVRLPASSWRRLSNLHCCPWVLLVVSLPMQVWRSRQGRCLLRGGSSSVINSTSTSATKREREESGEGSPRATFRDDRLPKQ